MTRSRFEVLNRPADGLNSSSKAPRIEDRGSGNTDVAKRKKKRSWVKREAKFEILEGKATWDLPIRTVSEANNFEPWRKKYERHQAQKRIVFLAMNPCKDRIKLPCRIMLTRFAPDKLDVFDNLPMSFKYIVDAVCTVITGEKRPGKADSDERITIACDQVKSDAYGIRIEVTW